MLEFVHLSGAEAGKDIQTRRKVRSQAMRDYRRRQRLEREAGERPPIDPRPITGLTRTAQKASGLQTSKSAGHRSSSSGAHRDRSASSGMSVLPVERRGAHSTAHDQAPYAAFLSKDIRPAPPLSRASTPSITLYGDYPSDTTSEDVLFGPTPLVHSAQPEWLDPALLRISPHPQPLWIPRSPSPGRAETTDPFDSPAQVDRMLAFCKSCSFMTTNLDLCDTCTNGSHSRRALAEAWYGF